MSLSSEELPYEERLTLATERVNSGVLSIRGACDVYDISRTTLYRRMQGIQCKAQARARSHRLNTSGERALIDHIRSLDESGFPPSMDAVKDAARYFSVIESGVGKNWATRFIKRQPELKARFTRSYDYQRSLCEDPVKLNDWFQRYLDTKAEYEIHDSDIYNMDETGFQMGVINSSLGVMCSERPGRGRRLQPGNKELVSVIMCIGGCGYSVPPFVIMSGNHQLENWHDGKTCPGWMFAATVSGWTDNEKAVQWLKHFDDFTVERANGRYRMLIIDGHRSHVSVPFRTYCEENKIITVCIPPHSSHLLQPLDVGFFSVMKRQYTNELRELTNNRILGITQSDFISCFRSAYDRTVSESLIASSFRAAGLAPYCPDKVLSKLTVKNNRSMTPVNQESYDSWQSQTPHNRVENAAQFRLVMRMVQTLDPNAPGALLKVWNYAQTLEQRNELLQDRIDKVDRALRERVGRRRRARHISGLDSVYAQELNERNEALISQDEQRALEKDTRRCKKCKQPGHNIRTCGAVVSGARGSDEEEEEAGEISDEEEGESGETSDEYYMEGDDTIVVDNPDDNEQQTEV